MIGVAIGSRNFLHRRQHLATAALHLKPSADCRAAFRNINNLQNFRSSLACSQNRGIIHALRN